jgi:glycerol-3-phosphate acyltransferase PlsX
MIRVAVDAMGSDSAPGPEVAGAVAANREAPLEIILVGDQARIGAELARIGATAEPRIHVQHASEVVSMHDAPGQVFRKKPDSSMRVAFDLVSRHQAQAVVSAGNSGAVLGHALFVLGRLPGVERPGIVTVLPSATGALVLCDVGANVEVKPAMLAQFGVLGACYDQIVHGHARPRVGILSNATEATKGTELTRAAHALLCAAAQSPDARFDYHGYVEGSNIFQGQIDVVATDGFTGNVVLKLTEGVAEAVFRMTVRALEKSALGRVGGALIRPAMREVQTIIDYAETGGALLAGVNGVVTLCHGRSDVSAMKNAIKATARFVRNQLVAQLGRAIADHQRIWTAHTAVPDANPDAN